MQSRIVATMLIFSLLAPWSLCANPVPATQETTQGIVENLDKQIKVANEELQAAYDKQLARRDDDLEIKLLKESQQTWTAYRNVQCELEADEARGGTLARVLRLKCCLRMTQSRTAELNALVPLLGH